MLDKTYKEPLPHDIETLLFQEAERINLDMDYHFQLRGNTDNGLIDAALPLIGMVIRVRKLAYLDDVSRLYSQTVNEISAIEIELNERGYENAIIIAYRYVLCSFIDEAVMGTEWGSHSEWAEHSLLTRFHNETWGGEKVFTILNRLQDEPTRYQDILEFIFLCFNLGFEGRYKVLVNGKDEYKQIVGSLYDLLKKHRREPSRQLTNALNNVANTKYRLSKQLPVWSVFALFGGVILTAFIFYSWSLHSKSSMVLEQLDMILR
ncbi:MULTISPECIES: type IVB secretion system protein IcmH/DotU [unclassified Motilimonas]|uniref:type IVB secretion system protein IcmH/DotU n=1 Tax=unclassified Motilimonas TaxID=2643697 RepID=UPI001E554F8B|nr:MULTISPECIES: type IVB secretion system protein IcmH/DotU [unclassified Motilimonas]MCE0559223.1 type IVB secretion system protein IcmH/DotU [Motilimonas sp. E26]MDO6527516.1 type IVB secretion system protein IcmH/DotU [Motilimonas sp. 1_MG-2023]